MRPRISTTIDQELHKKALIYSVSWSEALETGIKVLIGEDREIEQLEKNIKQLTNELQLKKDKLIKMKKEDEKDRSKTEFDTPEDFIREVYR